MAVYRNRARDIVERLILLRDYIHTNASPTHAVKAKDMQEYLKSKGCGSKDRGIEIKTLYADLNMLGACFRDVKIRYDGRQKGYVLDQPPLSSHDLRLIANSVQAAQFITQEEANKLTDKLIGLADEYTKKLLDRRTFVANRARTMNDRLMKDLDTIYEAIAQNRKISFKYFEYALTDHKLTKRYHNLDSSKIITANPCAVVWASDRFWLYAVLKIPKNIWYKAGLEYDSEYGKYIDTNGEFLEDGDSIDFQCENMDDTGSFVYEFERLDLALIEQIKVLPEKREGISIAQGWIDYLNTDTPSKIVKLKADNWFVSEVIDKFGRDIPISPDGDESFVATIHEELTPELYMWTQRFDPPIEIIYPENAEADLRAYFLSLAKGEAPDGDFYGAIKSSFPYDNIR